MTICTYKLTFWNFSAYIVPWMVHKIRNIFNFIWNMIEFHSSRYINYTTISAWSIFQFMKFFSISFATISFIDYWAFENRFFIFFIMIFRIFALAHLTPRVRVPVRAQSVLPKNPAYAANQFQVLILSENLHSCNLYAILMNMTKTYTLTKREVVQALNIEDPKLNKLVKSGKLSRERKDPENNRSAWLYSIEDVTKLLETCTPSDSCCQEKVVAITEAPSKKRWFEFWK